MSGIEQLQRRVAEAQKRFGLIDARQKGYGERLIRLMRAVEDRLHQSLAETERQKAEIGRQRQENELLRGLLHALLQAVEGGSRDHLSETMQALDRRVSALIAEAPALEDEAPAADLAEAPAGPESAAEAEAPAAAAAAGAEMTEPSVAPSPGIEREALRPETVAAAADSGPASGAPEGQAAGSSFAGSSVAGSSVAGPSVAGPSGASAETPPGAPERSAPTRATEVQAGDVQAGGDDAPAADPEAEAPGATQSEGLTEIMGRVAQLAQELAATADAPPDAPAPDRTAAEAPPAGEPSDDEPAMRQGQARDEYTVVR
ncbi:MAG: hypothetical protein ACE5KF_08905 [Kiloniellaceae bacterium]